MKYENIDPRSKLHKDEPWFFIRAADKLSAHTVVTYAAMLDITGDKKGAMECMDIADLIQKWQKANPTLVKQPD
jgi:hypothetical protein